MAETLVCVGETLLTRAGRANDSLLYIHSPGDAFSLSSFLRTNFVTLAQITENAVASASLGGWGGRTAPGDTLHGVTPE